MPRTIFSTTARKPREEVQNESRVGRLLAPVTQYLRRPQSRQPSPSASSRSEPTEEQSHSVKSGEHRGKNDLWSKAYNQLPEEYRESLDDLDKLDVLQGLFTIAKQAEEQNAAKQLKVKLGGKEIDVGKKAEGFVACLHRFKEIGDIVVQYDPAHAALPWAGVRFILTVCDPASSPLRKVTNVS